MLLLLLLLLLIIILSYCFYHSTEECGRHFVYRENGTRFAPAHHTIGPLIVAVGNLYPFGHGSRLRVLGCYTVLMAV